LTGVQQFPDSFPIHPIPDYPIMTSLCPAMKRPISTVPSFCLGSRILTGFLGAVFLAGGIPAASAGSDGRVLIGWEAEWRYFDGETEPEGWRDPGFDDSGWESGKALLGYDTRKRSGNWPAPGLNTRMAPNRIGYALRHTFEFDGDPAATTLVIDQVIDDGAVYFLNGEEIARTATMPGGEVGFSTPAARVVGTPVAEMEAIRLAGSSLRAGRNVLAVSLHNQGTGSSDICFGMRLRVADGVFLEEPPGLILTWQNDPTSTMTIDWHRLPEHADRPARIEARPRGSDEWTSFDAERLPFPHSDRLIDRVEISGLRPGSEVEFRGGPESQVYWFRTMPAGLEEPLVFASGGDVRHRRSWMEEGNRAAMEHDPEFIVWGGDLAYADGRPDNVHIWYEYLEVMVKTLVTPDGRVPPVVVAIGNHEIRGGYHRDRISGEDERRDLAPFFYGLFAFPGQPGYGTLDFGNYLSLVIGDSGHSNPIAGEQTRWLRRALAERSRVPHLIPVYHVPAWPSHRGFGGRESTEVRDHWVPLFERHGVRLALEHHDHTYKRTVPIFRGSEDAERGIVYVGDGCWGVGTRTVHPPDSTWYLERAESVRHVLIITLRPDGKTVDAYNAMGEKFDSVTLPVRDTR